MPEIIFKKSYPVHSVYKNTKYKECVVIASDLLKNEGCLHVKAGKSRTDYGCLFSFSGKFSHKSII